MGASLTIGQLAEGAATQPGTLRMWEARYGFPRAERLASGHRRYSEDELERVRDVLALRATGLSLRAAIDRVLNEPAAPVSIFAGLRQRLPELTAHPLPKRVLLAMSHALEDEASAHGEGGLLAGSFQRERFYRQSQPRWRLLAAPTELSFVLADFERGRTPRPASPSSCPWIGPTRSPASGRWSGTPRASRPVSPLASARAPSCPTLSASSTRSGRSSATSSGRPRRSRSSWRGRPRPSCRCRPGSRVPPDRIPTRRARATALTNRMLAYVAASIGRDGD